MRILLQISLICLMSKHAWARGLEFIAQRGQVLIQSSLLSQDSADLKGDWLYFQKQTIPTDSDCLQSSTTTLPILHYWKKGLLEQYPERSGTSSFCLVINNPDRGGLSLWWPDRPEVDIYANGSLIFGRGELHKGQGPPRPFGRQTGLMRLPDSSKITLVVHADNSFMRWRDNIEPIRVGPTNVMQNEFERILVFQAIVVSALACMGLYLFVLFLINRNYTESLILSLFCCGMAIRQGTLHSNCIMGIMAPYALGHHTYSLHFVSYYLASTCFFQFLHLSYSSAMKRWTIKFCWAMCGLASILSIIFAQAVYSICLRAYNIMAIIFILYCIKIVAQRFWVRKYESLALSAGVVVIGTASILDASTTFGMERSIETLDLAMLFFVLITSFLVSIKYFEAFSRLYFFSGELAKIVPQHVVDRIHQGFQLEHCMPVGEKEGIVLVFDVAASSTIQHPGFREALEGCMTRFYKAVNDHYDPVALTAEAYRLKEMGDGMICTIGYPYAVPRGESLNIAAVKLTEKLHRIFVEEMQVVSREQPVYCGMGLARGMLEGFFPRTGQKQYDLRGRPLILATRYEGMRKVIHERYGRKGSILFIPDSIYQGLTPKLQETFELWDATLPGHQIRDDESTTRAWFRVLSTE